MDIIYGNTEVHLFANCPELVIHFLIQWKNSVMDSTNIDDTTQYKVKVSPLINFYDPDHHVHLNLIKKLDKYCTHCSFYIVRITPVVNSSMDYDNNVSCIYYCLVHQRNHSPTPLLFQCINFIQKNHALKSYSSLPDHLQNKLETPVTIRDTLFYRFGMKIYNRKERYDIVHHFFVGTKLSMISKIQDLITFVHHVLELLDLLTYSGESSLKPIHDIETAPDVELSRYCEVVPELFEIHTKQRGFGKQDKLIWYFVNTLLYIEFSHFEAHEVNRNPTPKNYDFSEDDDGFDEPFVQ